MKIFVLLIIAATIGHSIAPEIYGIKDTGSMNLPNIDVNLSIDCTNKNLELFSNVDDAQVTMFYTDYGYSPLPNRVKTNEEGYAIMEVPGSLNYLTGLFILRIDKQGFKSREIEFTYGKCFQNENIIYNGTVDVGEKIIEEIEESNISENKTIDEEIVDNKSEIKVEIEPNIIESEVEEDSQPKEKTSSNCIFGIILLGLLILGVKR